MPDAVVAVLDFPAPIDLEPETAGSDVRNALQVLEQPAHFISRSDVEAVKRRLWSALEKIDELEAKCAVLSDMVHEADDERLLLVDEAKDRQEFTDSLEMGGLHVEIPWDSPTAPYRLQRIYYRTIVESHKWATIALVKTELVRFAHQFSRGVKS